MTSKNNPFADRLAKAAKEGYVNGTRRTYGSPFTAPRPAAAPRLATEKQLNLLDALWNERQISAETRIKWIVRLEQLMTREARSELTTAQASAMIEYLFGLPMRAVEPEVTHVTSRMSVPAGHYAIEQDDTVVFLKVDRPIEGKWAGKVFVALQHGDDYTTMSQAAGLTMLGRIVEQGIMDCSIRYGRELGKCGVCHRTLTNETSRSAGIGPKCAEKFGM